MSAQKKNKRTGWILPTIIATGFAGLFAWGLSSTDTGKQIKAYVAEKLNIKDFRKKYLPFAQESERTTGVPALVTLAQAALESGWGKSAPAYNFFGIKANSKWTGKRQLLKTTEYLPDGQTFPEIIDKQPTGNKNAKGQPLYKYVIRDYFRAYDSPADAFRDKGTFLKTNKRYTPAFANKNPFEFANAIAKAGYASDPDYAQKLLGLIRDFQNLT